jgi:hypothetical protein
MVTDEKILVVEPFSHFYIILQGLIAKQFMSHFGTHGSSLRTKNVFFRFFYSVQVHTRITRSYVQIAVRKGTKSRFVFCLDSRTKLIYPYNHC